MKFEGSQHDQTTLHERRFSIIPRQQILLNFDDPFTPSSFARQSPTRNMAKPESGRLATHEDMEQFMSLDGWLGATDPIKLKVNDAWSEGNTDQAFSFNNCTGVQRSHRGNDWNFFGIDLAGAGHGTYVYLPRDPVFIQNLSDPEVSTNHVTTIPLANETDSPQSLTVTYTNLFSQSTTIINTEHMNISVNASFNLEGFGFGVNTSFDSTNSTENSKSLSSSLAIETSITIPAHSTYNLDVSTETTTKQMQYGLDIAISSNHPDGGIAKATDDKGTWSKFFRIEELVQGGTTRTAKYNVTTEHAVTRIKTTPAGTKLTAPMKTLFPDQAVRVTTK